MIVRNFVNYYRGLYVMKFRKSRTQKIESREWQLDSRPLYSSFLWAFST